MTARPRTPLQAPQAAQAVSPPAAPDAHQALAAALQCLDALLGLAVDHQARRLGPASLLDPWLGMHLEAADVQRLLGEAAHRPLAARAGAAPVVASGPRPLPGRAVPRSNRYSGCGRRRGPS